MGAAESTGGSRPILGSASKSGISSYRLARSCWVHEWESCFDKGRTTRQQPTHGETRPPGHAMTDDPFYAPNHKPPAPAPPRPQERLWSLRKGDRRIDYALLVHGEHSVEAALRRDGAWYAGPAVREPSALAHAERNRSLKTSGHTSAECSGVGVPGFLHLSGLAWCITVPSSDCHI